MNNTKQIKQTLGRIFDTFSSKGGVYTIKKSYFYGFGKDGSALVDKVQQKLPQAVIVDYGNHWHPFVGGAKPGSTKDSFYFCKFKIA